MNEHLLKAQSFLEQAVKKGVNSGFFFLGIMAIEGVMVKKDV